jgi:phage FluMu gp28-like protein
MPDALELGLLNVVNRVRGLNLSANQFLADCRSRSRLEEIYQQTYLCNPAPGGVGIVDWSAIERCRFDYQIERLHLEHEQIQSQFGEFNPLHQTTRENEISKFILQRFQRLFKNKASLPFETEILSTQNRPVNNSRRYRLGFDVAASGQGDLAAIYIDEAPGPQLWLRALFTCRTDDWHFLKSVLYTFLRELNYVRALGDETGLGRQICWEAAQQFPSRFQSVNFSSKKHDLGFSLMNQLSVAEKRVPRSEPDIAADFFALRKVFTGTKWIFTEGRNTHNPASHCDIAWAGALASFAHAAKKSEAWALVG